MLFPWNDKSTLPSADIRHPGRISSRPAPEITIAPPRELELIAPAPGADGAVSPRDLDTVGPTRDLDRVAPTADGSSLQPPRQVSGIQPTATFLASDRFIELDMLGQGGMGTVVRAFDRELRRHVAVKVLDPANTTPEDLAQLAEEARIVGRLEHPNIPPVYELGTDKRGARYLSMKLVNGRSLEDTLTETGVARLYPERLKSLLGSLLKVCDAVAFAHSRGILHCDIKPSNIMVSDFDEVYLVDWGVARPMIRPGRLHLQRVEHEDGDDSPSDPCAMVGTPRYMAPEQLHGLSDQLDVRTDVFGLGATLYQILTGQPPHDADSWPNIALQKTRITIPPPQSLVEGITVPGELSRIALKALSHDPAARHASVEELKRDLERFQHRAWHLPQERFAARSVITAEGERSDVAYIVVEGSCVATRKDGAFDVPVREIGPGDVFGETGIFSDRIRTMTVHALTDVVVMVVRGDILASLLGLPWMGGGTSAVADRVDELDARLQRLEVSQDYLREG